MKALFYKDLHVSGRNALVMLCGYFAVVIGLIVLGFLSDVDRLFSYIQIATLFYGIFFMSVISFPEAEKESKWYIMESAMPIKKKDLVNEKFLMTVVFSFILIMVHFVVLFIVKDTLMETYNHAVVGIDYSNLTEAQEFIIFPFFIGGITFIATMASLLSYDTGSRVGYVICGSIIFLIILAVTFVIFENMIPADNEYGKIWDTGKLGLIVWGVTIVGTYIVSRTQINKREYL